MPFLTPGIFHMKKLKANHFPTSIVVARKQKVIFYKILRM